MKHLGLAGLLAIVLCPAAATAEKTTDELEKELDSLKSENQRIIERLDATMDEVEKLSADQAAVNGEKDKTGAGKPSRVHIGGYGELHYNNWQNQTPGGADKKEIDFHRFVLYFGYDFTDSIRFVSELELEHAVAGEGKNGEIELEQAYVEFDVGENLSTLGGLFLVPVGILNETHEPPTFYGVERNPVEKNIIPTTWWECGGAVRGRFGKGFSYDVTATSGLLTDAGSNYKVRNGRQKCSEAIAEDPAYTGRLKWTAVPGLEVAATYQRQTNITQSTDPTAGAADLFEAHVAWQHAGFGLRALYARWDLDGSGPASIGANEQTGWYIEPSWKFHRQVGVFARYNSWDNQAGSSVDTEFTQVDVGLNYWPHPDVVVKFDYQDQSVPTGKDEFDGVNVGIGFQF
jgi:hypothetical protein